MKIGRQLIGKTVAVTYVDPNYGKIELAKLKRGRAALATWTEYGVVHDVSEGVLILIHSIGKLCPDDATADEVCCTAIPEDIVETMVVLSPETDTKG
mgnify:FL=1